MSAPQAGDASALPGPLHGLRVLELADEKGQFCGKLMADLGADVLKIEPPGGQHTRRIGPFLDDIPHRERSLFFWHYNTSKRGITLNLEHPDGSGAPAASRAHARIFCSRPIPPGICQPWAWGMKCCHPSILASSCAP